MHWLTRDTWIIHKTQYEMLGVFRAAAVPLTPAEGSSFLAPSWAVMIYHGLPTGSEVPVLRAAAESEEFRAAVLALLVSCAGGHDEQAVFDLLDAFIAEGVDARVDVPT